MNSVFLFVLILVGIVTAGRIIRHYMQLQENKPRHDDAARTQIESLEQRVQTLEKIVTDKGYDLEREFENLS